MWSLVKLLLLVFVHAPFHCLCVNPADVIFAVNAGGEEHVDLNGIRYEKDYNRHGIASDHGKQKRIYRVAPYDQILYQTERYSHDTFGYSIPIDLQMEGDYVMVLKFSEVYFMRPGEKVFSVVLNGLTVVPHLDIFEKVGYAVAHDVHIEFQVFDSILYWENKQSRIMNSQIRVDFVKGDKDNPKINALYVAHCTIKDIPKLPLFHLVQVVQQHETLQDYYEATQFEELELYIAEKKKNQIKFECPRPIICDDYKLFSKCFPVVLFLIFTTLLYLTSNFV